MRKLFDPAVPGKKGCPTVFVSSDAGMLHALISVFSVSAAETEDTQNGTAAISIAEDIAALTLRFHLIKTCFFLFMFPPNHDFPAVPCKTPYKTSY
jgi:hypothetical protein